MAISDFIDVDFPGQPQYVAGYSPDEKPGICRGAFGDSFELVPESQWKEAAAAMEEDGGGLSRGGSFP